MSSIFLTESIQFGFNCLLSVTAVSIKFNNSIKYCHKVRSFTIFTANSMTCYSSKSVGPLGYNYEPEVQVSV